MRKTSTRSRVGRVLYRRQNQWNISTAHLMPSMSSLSSLLPTQHGSLQGEITWRSRERLKASMATNENHVNKLALPRGVVNESIMRSVNKLVKNDDNYKRKSVQKKQKILCLKSPHTSASSCGLI